MAHEQRSFLNDNQAIRGADGGQLSNRAQLARSGASPEGEKADFTGGRTLGDTGSGLTDGAAKTRAEAEKEAVSKTCTKCRLPFPLSDFYARRYKTGLVSLTSECKSCNRAKYRRAYKTTRPVNVQSKQCNKCGQTKEASHFYKDNLTADGLKGACRACVDSDRSGWRRRVRLEAIAAYGGACSCCGERQFEFLAFDHIAGGGSRHRDSINRNWAVFLNKLKKQGFPEGLIRLLCHNCNQALGVYGYCPHSKQREVAA